MLRERVEAPVSEWVQMQVQMQMHWEVLWEVSVVKLSRGGGESSVHQSPTDFKQGSRPTLNHRCLQISR